MSLIQAIADNHTYLIQKLLESNPFRIYKRDKNGNTPLILACYREKNRQIIELLLDTDKAMGTGFKRWYTKLVTPSSGCPYIMMQNKSGLTALMIAVRGNYKEIVKLLLTEDDNAPALYSRTHLNIQNGCGDTALMIAVRGNHKEIVELLLTKDGSQLEKQNQHGYTALMIAVQHNHEEIIELLLTKCDPMSHINKQDKNGSTVLMMAQCIEVVEQLLTRIGTQLLPLPQQQLRNEYIGMQNNDGYTALMKAAYHNQVEIVILLLNMGGPLLHNHFILKQDKRGRTALMEAVARNNREIVQILLDATRDSPFHHEHVDCQDRYGCTALFHASIWGHKKVIKLLLLDGASIFHRNHDGRSAVDLACHTFDKSDEESRRRVRELLLNYGPKHVKKAKGASDKN